ncbi:hypothetical protein FM106_13825 [Brachybacterium faecium]|nr:hypothetical protein FM106_13825 [Brachybacterium faecium]
MQHIIITNRFKVKSLFSYVTARKLESLFKHSVSFRYL